MMFRRGNADKVHEPTTIPSTRVEELEEENMLLKNELEIKSNEILELETCMFSHFYRFSKQTERC